MLLNTPFIKSARILSTVAVAALLAGCSGSIERFVSSYKNPSDADPVYTATVPKPSRSTLIGKNVDSSADANAIAAKPLDQTAPKLSYNYSKRKALVAQEQVAEVDAESAPAIDEAPAKARQVSSVSPSRKSGKLRVEQGMTLYSIALANDLSVRAIANANGIRSPYRIREGQILNIPGKSRVVVPTTTLAMKRKQIELDAPKEVAVADDSLNSPTLTPATYEVKSGDTLYSIGRSHHLSPAEIAEENGLTLKSRLALGQTLKLPGKKSTESAQVADNATPGSDNLGQAPDSPAKVSEVPAIPAPGETTSAAALDAKQVKPIEPLQAQQQAANISTGMNLRWPVRGKIISEFGNKPGGLKNEGINIAVPEGTAVRAAETGVIAYAGNELKGYGNLILIRHEGGFVTAYAHAKELFVKKGDTIKRGDVIAKAGQTGAVSSPQLHFEVRKGATALDPVTFLSSATASN